MTSPTINKPTNAVNPAAAAFTLIELILVMAMLLVVLSVSAPALREFFRGRNLDAEARRLLALTRYGQSRAVHEGIPMILWLDPATRTYGMEAAPGFFPVDPRAVTFTMATGVEMEPTISPVTPTLNLSTAFSGPAIRFTPDGFISDTSPEAVLLREGDQGLTAVARTGNRLRYEIRRDDIQLLFR